MFLLAKPSPEAIRQFLSDQQDTAFSYGEVGASRDAAPSNYNVDHSRSKLGSGPEVFALAVDALLRWEMFRIGWVELLYPETPIQVGATVAVLAHYRVLWFLNACRIVYLVESKETVQRYGFAYGTLEEHAERGEERFSVEWRRDDDSVWYDILAFSQPKHILARLGYPVTRRLQKRFARDSHQAMLQAVNGKR